VSVTVASGAILLLLRSPFSVVLIALLLFSRFALFEYSVMARNYGISMLLMFLFATLYDRHRDRGIVLGIVLFLLANSNAHSALIAGAFLCFWMFDIAGDKNIQRSWALKVILLNGAIVTLGAVICALTIYPTYNDAAVVDKPDGTWGTLLLKGIFLPAERFHELLIPQQAFEKLSRWTAGKIKFPDGLMSLLMLGSTLGLVRRPAAFFAALLGLIGFSVFFSLVYAGQYRHDALWLVFLISMYWIVGAGTPRESNIPERFKAYIHPVSIAGYISLALLVLLQVPQGLAQFSMALDRERPNSRSYDLSLLVKSQPELHDAMIIADPDYLIEALPYYMSNPTYLMREQRFGNVTIFTWKARLELSLDDILTDAARLRQQMHKPIIILLGQKLDSSLPAQSYSEGYNWKLTTTPSQISRFLSSAKLIKSFGPVHGDESFDVYTLN
jgi:hypothetical protein